MAKYMRGVTGYLTALLFAHAYVDGAAFVKKSPKEIKIGVQGLGFGRGNPRIGTETGPAVVRNGGFIEFLKDEAGVDVKDYGDMLFEVGERIRTPLPDATKESGGLMNLADVSKACKKIAEQSEKIAKDGRIVFSVGGDHSITIGTIHGVSNVYPDLSILYVDAHADLNTVKTSPSGNLHGMTIPFAVKEFEADMASITGPGKEFEWVKPRVPIANVAHIGLRSVDPGERDNIDKYKVKSFGVRDIDYLGMIPAIKKALEQISPGGSRPIHLSFDVDVLDDLEIGSQTGTPEPGGLTLREAMTFIEVITDTANIVSVEFTEVNAALGVGRPPARTAQLVKYLMGCVVGYCRGGLNRAQISHRIGK